MIREERLLKVILAPHISEKSTIAAEENNTIVFKVTNDATKAEIKDLGETSVVIRGKDYGKFPTKEIQTRGRICQDDASDGK